MAKGKDKKDNKKPKSVRGLWHSDGMVSQEGLEATEVSISCQSHPTQEDCGNFGSYWKITPGEWTGSWYYSSADKCFMDSDEQKVFLETLFLWPIDHNMGKKQGRWKFLSADIRIFNRKSIQTCDETEVTLKVNFDERGYYNRQDLDSVIQKYKEIFDSDNIFTCMEVLVKMFFDGKGNPNGDPHNGNSPREVFKSNGQYEMTSMCLHNKVREVLRNRELPTYFDPGCSISTIETREPWASSKKVEDFRKGSLDAKWFGATRAFSSGSEE